jgi:hypothetical protein
VTAVWARARAELRARWHAWLGLALLLGLEGALVTALAAGARRADSAYDRLLAAERPGDLEIGVGALADPLIPAMPLLLAVPVVVLIANLVAAVPARSAAAIRPAVVLRSE